MYYPCWRGLLLGIILAVSKSNVILAVSRGKDGLSDILLASPVGITEFPFKDDDCGSKFPRYFDDSDVFLAWAKEKLLSTSSSTSFATPSISKSLKPHLPGGNLVILTFSNLDTICENVYKTLYLIDTAPYTIVNVFSREFHERKFGPHSNAGAHTMAGELPFSIEFFLEKFLKMWEETVGVGAGGNYHDIEEQPYILYVDGFDNLYGGCGLSETSNALMPHQYIENARNQMKKWNEKGVFANIHDGYHHGSSGKIERPKYSTPYDHSFDLYGSTQINLWPWVYGSDQNYELLPKNPRGMIREGLQENLPASWPLSEMVQSLPTGPMDEPFDICLLLKTAKDTFNGNVDMDVPDALNELLLLDPSLLVESNCPLPMKNRFDLATVDEDDGIPNSLDTNRWVNAVFNGRPKPLLASLRETNRPPFFVKERMQEYVQEYGRDNVSDVETDSEMQSQGRRNPLWRPEEKISASKIEKTGNLDNYQMIRQWILGRDLRNHTLFDFGANVMWNYYSRHYEGGFASEVELRRDIDSDINADLAIISKRISSRSFGDIAISTGKDVCIMHFCNRPGKKEMLWLYGWQRKWEYHGRSHSWSANNKKMQRDQLLINHFKTLYSTDQSFTVQSRMTVIEDPVGFRNHASELLEHQETKLSAIPHQHFVRAYRFTKAFKGSDLPYGTGPRLSVDLVVALPKKGMKKSNLCKGHELRFSFKIENDAGNGVSGDGATRNLSKLETLLLSAMPPNVCPGFPLIDVPVSGTEALSECGMQVWEWMRRDVLGLVYGLSSALSFTKVFEEGKRVLESEIELMGGGVPSLIRILIRGMINAESLARGGDAVVEDGLKKGLERLMTRHLSTHPSFRRTYEVGYVRSDKVMVWEEKRAENSFGKASQHSDDCNHEEEDCAHNYSLMTVTTMLSEEIQGGIRPGSFLAVNLHCSKPEKDAPLLWVKRLSKKERNEEEITMPSKKESDQLSAVAPLIADQTRAISNQNQTFDSLLSREHPLSVGGGIFEKELNLALGASVEGFLGGNPEAIFAEPQFPEEFSYFTKSYRLTNQANSVAHLVKAAWARKCYWPQVDGFYTVISTGDAAIEASEESRHWRPTISVTYATEEFVGVQERIRAPSSTNSSLVA